MAGTTDGGKNAAKSNKERYGLDYYAKIGRLGGKKSRGGGFASDKIGKDGLTGKQRARIAGVKGGKTSRRTGTRNTDKTDHVYESILDRGQL